MRPGGGDLAGNDLGRVIIQHEGLHDPIVIPLQPWDEINADVVMGTIEKRARRGGRVGQSDIIR